MSLKRQLAEFDAPVKGKLNFALRKVRGQGIREDAAQEARIAYWIAAQAFDDSRGATLAHYCGFRMQGAVKDFFRHLDVLSRHHRKAAELGLEIPIRQSEAALYRQPSRAPSPEDSAAAAELRRDLLTFASPRERVVLMRYFFDGMSLSEIAADLGVAQSRVSQIKSRGLRRIREAIGHGSSLRTASAAG